MPTAEGTHLDDNAWPYMYTSCTSVGGPGDLVGTCNLQHNLRLACLGVHLISSRECAAARAESAACPAKCCPPA